MQHKFHILRILGLLVALFVSTVSRGQFVEFSPIQKQKFKNLDLSKPSSRILETNTLPFWDDFSTGLDTLKWEIDGASYTETIGLNPPSIGMVLFNGVDENGVPYSLAARDQGETDFLTSRPFDLSDLNDEEQESLYFSFFWQAGGRGELPDENDQLSLQLLDTLGSWLTVWTQAGGVDRDRESFAQEIIQIQPEWQHENFQFRFTSTGRQSGAFDSWLVDYIFFDSGRNEGDLDYPDRSLTQSNSLRIGDFGAYPLSLLEGYLEEQESAVSNQFFNLEDRFRAMEYSISIQSPGNEALFLNQNTPFNPVPNALERRDFESNLLTQFPLPTEEGILQITSSLITGDDFLFEVVNGDTIRYESVDFTSNDTVQTQFPLMDYMAYDNGSADYAAGINQRSGELAVQYNVPQEVYLTGISINFSNPRQANQAIDIIVWENLDEEPIFRREDLIPVKEPGEEFLFYSLDTNIQVNGDFYVGFAQFTNDFIEVGLDKINDSGEKIFYNVLGEWQQNEEVSGSLMIRPHVALDPPFEESELPSENLRIFPNPVESYLNLEGDFDEIRVFDSFGREIFPSRELTEKGEIVNFSGQISGIYLINAVIGEKIKSYRIVVK